MRGIQSLAELSRASKEARIQSGLPHKAATDKSTNLSLENHPVFRQIKAENEQLKNTIEQLKIQIEDLSSKNVSLPSESSSVVDDEIVAGYVREIQNLKLENSILQRAQDSSLAQLSKNEEKILNAIRVEVMEQKISEPVIGRNCFSTKYGINKKFLDESVKLLEGKGLIFRRQIKYSGNVMTYTWKIL